MPSIINNNKNHNINNLLLTTIATASTIPDASSALNAPTNAEDALDTQTLDGFLDDDVGIPLIDSPNTIRDDSKNCCPSQQFENQNNSNLTNLTSENAHTTYKMIIAVILCLIFMVTEFIGGYFAGSLAIMTDAAHLSSDCISFVIGILAIWISKKPPDSCMSFGYKRMEILGAVASILTIWFLTAFLVYLAIIRIVTKDYNIDADLMLIASSVGIFMNILMASILHGSCFFGKYFHVHSHGLSSHSHNHHHHNHQNLETIRNNNNNNNNGTNNNNNNNNNGNNNRNSSSSSSFSSFIHFQRQPQQNLLLQTQRTTRMNVYVDSNEMLINNKRDINTSGNNIINNNGNNNNNNNNNNNSNSGNINNSNNSNNMDLKLTTTSNTLTPLQQSQLNQDHFQLYFSHQNQNRNNQLRQSNQQRQLPFNNLTRTNNSNRSSRNELLISSDTSSSNSISSVVRNKNKKNVNLRAAMLHVVGDLIQSIGVFIASVLIKIIPEAKVADPICTLIFSIIVIITTLKIIKESIFILLDAVPYSISMDNIEYDLKKIQGIKFVHDINVWSLSVNHNIATAHIVIDKNVDSQKILKIATHLVRNRYNIQQTTFQIERIK